MASDVAQPDFENIDAQASAEQAEARPSKLRRIAVVASVGVILMAGAGYGGAYWLGLLGGDEMAAPPPPVFYDLPEMTVNLASVTDRPQYLKISAALEMKDHSVRSAIEPVLPRVLDAFQVYLRELRATDLEGSAGIYRLKEELVRRVNMAIHPAEIDGVAFREIIVQ